MITIIADDFTGANDTGIQFIDEGVEPMVLIRPDEDDAKLHCETPVLIIDTESRHLEKSHAYRTVSKIAKILEERTDELVVKKIDSTLRGNIGSEIDALMDSGRFSHAFVLAAAPENGRIVKHGICYIHGVEVHKTEFGQDPFSPVELSYLPDILSRQTKRKIDTIRHESLSRPIENIEEEIREKLRNGTEVLVVDALCMDDLDLAVQVIRKLEGRPLYVGSSGLGKVLFDKEKPEIRTEFGLPQDILFVVGSLKKISAQQFDFLKIHDGNMRKVCIDSESLLGDKNDLVDSIIESLGFSPGETRYLALKTPSELVVSGKKNVGEYDIQTTLDSVELGGKIAKSMGEISKEVIERGNFRTVFVTGGDTAYNIAERLKIKSLHLLREVLPGIPLCGARCSEMKEPFFMITKAGGFGDIDTLEQIIKFVKENKEGGE